MTWAWAIELPPTSKLVLMALADIADDQGICWPCQDTLAAKCSLTVRSVRRILLQLQAQRLLVTEPRFRQNGAQASSRYRLAVVGPPDTGGSPPRTPVSWGEDTGVLPRTTTEPSIEPSPPQPRVADEADTVAVGSGGGDLHFPTAISAAQRAILRARVATLPIELAQSVLDELAGRMTLTKVNNPIRYALVLMERLQARRFVPELGPKVAEMRNAEVARQARLAQDERRLQVKNVADTRKLPPKLRASLDRIRSKLAACSARDDNCPTPAISDSAPNEPGNG